MKQLLIALTLAAGLTGCAGRQYYNPAATDAAAAERQMTIDDAECERYALMGSPMTQIEYPEGKAGFSRGYASGYNQVSAGMADGARKRFKHACMLKKGYEEKKKPSLIDALVAPKQPE